MKLRFFPRGENFFRLFDQASDNLVNGANLLRDFMNVMMTSKRRRKSSRRSNTKATN